MNGAVRLRIEGRVQGVGYRAWLEDEARAQGLRGWVRNRRDGSVEALLIGPSAALMAVIGACRQGPRLAAVTNVAATPDQDDGSTGFRTAPTA
ncbi:MAG TPA: acylphosphatase [Stellaceae bacterium]|nr:acylphosphatase [Stellaceae bacterium]